MCSDHMCNPHQVYSLLQLSVAQQQLPEIEHLRLILGANGGDVSEISEAIMKIRKMMAHVDCMHTV